MIQRRDIDSAQGAQLDIIGEIVGQRRVLAQADLYPFFGFEGHLASQSFGSYYKPTIGGYWYSYGSRIGGDVELNDDQYRQIIKAKIIKNNAHGLNEDFIALVGLFLAPKLTSVLMRVGTVLSESVEE